MNQNKLFAWVAVCVGLAAMVGLVVIWIPGCGNGEARNGEPTPSTERSVKPGDIVDASEIERQGARIGRIEFAFPEGRKITAENHTSILGRGTYRDWGVRAAVDFIVAPEFNLTAEIEKNDGSTIVARTTLDRSRYSEFRFDDPNVRLQLGTRAHSIIDGTVILLASVADGGIVSSWGVPGASRVGEAAVNRILQDDHVRRLVRGPMEGFVKSKVDVEKLEGATLRITYVNGIGTTRVEILEYGEGYDASKYPISEDEVRNLFPRINNFFALFARLFPDDSAYEGVEWTVNASDLPNAWPVLEGLQVSARGAVRLRMATNEEGDGERTARVEIPQGQDGYRVDFTRGSGQSRMSGQANLNRPAGHFLYCHDTKTIREMVTDGELDASQKSSSYWLFEANHAFEPRIAMRYLAKVDDSGTQSTQ